ncbi:hypothetical protein ACIFOC_02691 [Leucobacter aridicollis]|uniref:Ig-like domain-containing protein n=1 Tax=Leucobacter aridicollis TaxID=283878 RepID=UPI0037CADBA7
MAQTGKSKHMIRGRRLGTSIAAIVMTLALWVTLMPGAPAMAAPGNMGLSISNGGKTTVNSKNEDISFEAKISPPAGTVIEAGGVTTLQLDDSLKRTNNGPVPNGATDQVWNESTNTLTVTWGRLQPGAVYGISINAKPSALASKESTFQVTAHTAGTVAGAVTEQTVVSAPVVAEGSEFPDTTYPAPKPGDFTMVDLVKESAAGGTYDGDLTLKPTQPGVAFRDLRVVTKWGQTAGSDLPIPRTWFSNNGLPAMNPTLGLTSTKLADSATETVYSYGSFATASDVRVYVNSRVPNGIAPGRYSVPIEVQDVVNGVMSVIVSGNLTIVVPDAAPASVTMTTYTTQTEASAGELLKWGQGWRMPAVADPVGDLTITYAIPEALVPRGIYATIHGITPKRYEYTTDNDLAAATWQTLPVSARGVIDVTEPEGIRGIRLVMNDAREFRGPLFGGTELTLEVKGGQTQGQLVPLKVASVTYLDAVSGATVLPLTEIHDKSVKIVGASTALPVAGFYDNGSTDKNVASPFGKVYVQGSVFERRLFLSGAGRTAYEKPYLFVVVPAGMSIPEFSAPEVCAPQSFAYVWGCSQGVFNTYPTPTPERNSVKLSDGSTLYYARTTAGSLDAGRQGYTQMNAITKFSINNLLEGEHQLLIGGGSMVQDDFNIDSRNQAGYEKKPLSEAASYSSFSEVGGEISEALRSIGVSAENAFIAQKNLFVSRSTSLASTTTIKGSEDSNPIVQGEGTATTRPGGDVNYEVKVRNTGSVVYKNFQFIDVLPRTGDTLILNESASRGSAFDVNLSGNVKVLVNGKPSAGARLEYSTSLTPTRFDATGAEVAGDAWLPYTGSATGAMAIRVTLAPSVRFNPSDTVSLSFDATVPSSAPRDGSVANNSIAYRFQAGSGDWIAAESPAVAVQSSAPAGDIALAGQAVLDLNDDGKAGADEPGLNGGGVSLQLYKVSGGTPKPESSPVTPNTDAGVDGAFSFIGLEDGGTYRIKPVSSNPNVTFPSGVLDAQGYLKYAAVADAAANAGQDTSAYVGKSEFSVGTATDLAKWIKDLRVPVQTKTTVSGSVLLSDVTESPITSGTAPYVSDIEVTLKRGSTEVKTTQTTSTGEFSFAELDGVIPGDHSLVFTLPNGRELVASPVNNPAVFTPGSGTNAGSYSLSALQPGVGATGVSVYLTEHGVPGVTVQPEGAQTIADTTVNPTSGTVQSADAETEVVSVDWAILTEAGEDALAGKLPAGGDSVEIPADLADGSYTLRVTARDIVGNASAPAEIAFTVDRAAPALAAAKAEVTHTKGENPAPTDAAGWISMFGVTADDAAGVGVASAGIQVDASAVKNAAGTYPVKFTVKDAAGNASKTFTTSFVVAYVGDPTVMVGKSSIPHEMGDALPDDAGWISLFQVTAAAADASATVKQITVDASAVNTAVKGEYSVTFVATDSLGATSTVKSGTVYVRDTIAPTLKLAAAEVTFVKGDTPLATDGSVQAEWATLFGLSATDAGSGVPAEWATLAVDATAVDYGTVGSYPVKFTVQDAAKNEKSVTGSYIVNFAGDPVIDFTHVSLTHEIGTKMPGTSSSDLVTLFGASGRTAPGTTVESVTGDAAGVDFAQPGTYPVVFTVTDSVGNTATAETAFVVADTIAPKLALGTESVKFTDGDPKLAADDASAWIALFAATATDSGLGMPTTGTLGITVDASLVDYTTAGAYPVVFTATDNAGLTESATATYVVAFAGAPKVAFDTDTVRYEMGEAALASTEAEWKALFGATATSASGTTVRSFVVDASSVDYEKPGDYQVLFTVTDSFDNQGRYFATVTVEDTTAPALSFTTDAAKFVRGDAQVTDTAGWVALFGATATDAGTGMLVNGNAGITVDATNVNYDRAGMYEVVFTATDKAGNISTKVTVEYEVRFAGPVAVAFETDTVKVEMGDARPASDEDWTELFGATAQAAPGAELEKIEIDSSTVDFDALGSYQVVFIGTDNYGNSDSYEATYTVIDTIAPVVSSDTEERTHAMRAPDKAWTVNDWTAFFGVTAQDLNGSEPGSGVASWNVEQATNWLTPGRYEVTFAATDVAGNISDELVRTIIIQAPPTGKTITDRIPQDTAVTLTPMKETESTGTIRDLTDQDLGAPDAGGTLTRQGDTLRYTPKQGFAGVENASVTVTDDLGQTAVIEYQFTVVRAPEFADGAEISRSIPVDGEITLRDAATLPGIEGEHLTVTDVTAPFGMRGSVELLSTEGSSGDVRYVADGTAWAGDAEFTFTVTDDLGQSTSIPVSVTVVAPRLTLDIASGVAGEAEVTATASGLIPGAQYSLELHSSPMKLGVLTASRDGVAAFEITVPAQASEGQHNFVLFNSDLEERASHEFVVTQSAGSQLGGGAHNDSGVLSSTGAKVTAFGSAAALLFLVGVAAWIVALKRQRAQAWPENVRESSNGGDE